MGRLKESIDRLTFGNPRRCVRFVLWRFLDSLVTSVPSVVMVVATWLLVQPIVHPGAALDFVALWACVAVLAAQVLASYATSHKVYVLSCAGTADAVLDARLAMGEKLRRLPLGFYQRHDAGDIDSVLLRDYETVENYGAEVLSQAGMIAAKTTLSAVVLAFFDWRLALATFAVVPCALPFLWKGFNAMAQSSGRLTKASQECSSRTIEYVAGIRTLKAFNLAGTRFDSLRASFEELRKASLGKEEASRPVGVFGRALLLAGAGVVMLAGCALLQAQAVHPFVLLMFLLLALGIYEPIVTLFYFLSDFGNADAAGKRIERLLAEPELPEPPAEAPAAPHGHGIAFDDVSFSYGGDERALEHVSLTIPEGGLTALVGPSGSGKSTVAKLAARFWDPQAGTVTLGGADLARRAADDVLAGTSVVFQDVYLFHDTVAENIRMGRADATDEDVREAARLAACLDFIEALPDGFDTVGRRETAHLHRPRAAEGRAGRAPGRGHQLARSRQRGGRPAGDRRAGEAQDRDGHRAPPAIRARCRQHRGARQRPRGKPGNPRRAARTQPPVRRPLGGAATGQRLEDQARGKPATLGPRRRAARERLHRRPRWSRPGLPRPRVGLLLDLDRARLRAAVATVA